MTSGQVRWIIFLCFFAAVMATFSALMGAMLMDRGCGS